MKIEKLFGVWQVPDETVARFGPVRLVRKATGQHELFGGTANERAAVRQWCNQYAAFVVFAEPKTQETVLAA